MNLCFAELKIIQEGVLKKSYAGCSSFIFVGKFTLDFTYDLFFFSSTESVLINVGYYRGVHAYFIRQFQIFVTFR